MREITSASGTSISSSTPTPIEGDLRTSNGADVVAGPAPKKKICCACPSTKKLRDECVVMHGEAACTKWINAHKECLRSEGFKV